MNRLLLVIVLLAGTTLAAFAQEGDGIPADTEIKTTASGLKYSVLKAGDGAQVKKGDLVFVHYTGWLAKDGKKFDSSRDRDETFFLQVGVGKVIPGWDEGLQLMKVGSRYKFTIPFALAYGEEGTPDGTIPAKADLIFDVEIMGQRPQPKLADTDQKTESGVRWREVKAGTRKLDARDFAMLKYSVFSSMSGKLARASDEFPSAPGRPKPTFNGTQKDQGFPFMKTCWTNFSDNGVYWLQVPPAEGLGQRGFPGVIAPEEDSVWRLEVVKTIPFARAEGNPVKTTKTGLEYEIIRYGKGEKKPTTSSRVKVNYVGWLTEGKVFDASFKRGDASTFGVNQVIPGWTEGLQLMKPGAIYRFQIPWKLAYGANGKPPTIPAKADLIFWVELLEIL